ncbi:valyl-tRNA synthetase [Candidatus Endolissoclinum faulkneri L5]|uniref:Valine--tRNA ligase n=1 Tax=Candidatus Endolissoclinum faulkneri L5 TaxID=1401328 RepID=V9TVW7_9PROT|nr:valine--tRNA ligase [Candidatus Endolissoclinum faulkneri]AHC73475.1 valyl-tRNA synthetase [Candidatus Endolissoclinum faulkneri L5]
MLEKTYSSADVESRLYRLWEQSNAFPCNPESKALPCTIMMPPPNITGSLHMGHALTMTVQDILVRYYRMIGRDVLWLPGTDHAGIATQTVVERSLSMQGINHRDIGRKAFLDKVWEWKARSGEHIFKQLRCLGITPDWGRERFTMDKVLSKAVVKAFVHLYNEGLIYRDKRLVNWDPQMGTAISDLEVEQKEVDGSLWYFRYPLEKNPSKFIVVATTRPETMLGDTAVAVNPEDERYKDMIGQYVILPLVGRCIPIVGDGYVDPANGSGALKITPAHDFNDLKVSKRHNLEIINIMDAEGHLADNVPDKYRGLDRFVARKVVVNDMESAGLLEKIEQHCHAVPYGDRGSVPLEPWLTDQWYCDAMTLAKPAIEAVERGDTVFVPKNWQNTYFEWMKNIEPWCISRQLWWGHQIPAWYGPDGEVFVAESEEMAAIVAEQHYGQAVELTREKDVLDTWFSSALWAFSTLGWPDKTLELNRYYPSDILVTGFDIIFFWVARMMMMGLHFMNEVPFRTVYVHALVRDAKGQKMSKSKNNIVDPIDLINQYGADALRFTLASMTIQGYDIKLDEGRVKAYRNFATKIWNAARFCELHSCKAYDCFDPSKCTETVNRWIVSEVAKTAELVAAALHAYKFNEATSVIYQFFWGTFCDWYIEFTKPILQTAYGGIEQIVVNETRHTIAWTLNQALHLLHPIMPYISEELWASFGEENDQLLISRRWPCISKDLIDPRASREIDWLVRFISEIRSIRSEMNMLHSIKPDLLLVGANAKTIALMKKYNNLIGYLSRIASIKTSSIINNGVAVCRVIDEATIVLPVSRKSNNNFQERLRLTKEIKKLESDIAKINKKLSNKGFLAKAPDTLIQNNKDHLLEEQKRHDRLVAALTSLN